MKYVALIAEWVSVDFTKKRACIGHFRAGGGSAMEMASEIGGVIEGLGLSDFVRGITCDNEPAATKAAQKLCRLWRHSEFQMCVSHGIQLVQAACDKDPFFKKAHGHVRKLAANFKMSAGEKRALDEAQLSLAETSSASGGNDGESNEDETEGMPRRSPVHSVKALGVFAKGSDSDDSYSISDSDSDSDCLSAGVAISSGAGAARPRARERTGGCPRTRGIIQEAAHRWSSLLYLL